MAGTPRYLVVLYVLGMLITGTLNTLTVKIQFTMRSQGINGEEKTFSKPWFGTFDMMAAMALVGLVDWLLRCSRKTKLVPDSEEGTAPLLDAHCEDIGYWRKVCLVAIPAVFDLIATALCCIGILYIPASVWQMLRGSCLIFCAIFSITCLKRTLFAFNWLGLLFCVVGVVLVGYANVMSEQESSGRSSDGSSAAGEQSSLLFGMGLVILGQIVQAAQVIAEEWLMKDVDLPAMQIIGFEGVWGTLMMVALVYPLLYVFPGQDDGSIEDPFDTIAMMGNSNSLLGIVAIYLFSCGSFNAFGIAVTGALSSVHRMMLDASRTTVIWAFGLAVHHIDPGSPFGEAWTSWSRVQLVGFVILILGQSIYGEVLVVPGLYYPPKLPFNAQQWCSPGAQLSLASPLPRQL